MGVREEPPANSDADLDALLAADLPAEVLPVDPQPPPLPGFGAELFVPPFQAPAVLPLPTFDPLPPLPELPLLPLPLPPLSQPALLPPQYLRDPIISNVLSICHLGLKVDTQQVARRLWNAEHNRRQGCLTLKSAYRRLAVAVYPSGKMTCMGARSEAAARAELRRYARLVQRSIRLSELPEEVQAQCDPRTTHVYQNARFLGFRIANIKAEWELGFAVNLNRFYDAYASRFNVYYEPEIFPALKLTLTNPKLTMQVFSNGTVGITGATSAADVLLACKEVLYPLARPCELPSPA
eukprot:EG_transcript_16121